MRREPTPPGPNRHHDRGRASRGPLALLLGALAVVAGLLVPAAAAAQGTGGGAGSLRPYWHVFAAYALAWILVVGWALHIGRRLGRLEERMARTGGTDPERTGS